MSHIFDNTADTVSPEEIAAVLSTERQGLPLYHSITRMELKEALMDAEMLPAQQQVILIFSDGTTSAAGEITEDMNGAYWHTENEYDHQETREVIDIYGDVATGVVSFKIVKR